MSNRQDTGVATYRLRELAHTALAHDRVVPPVHLPDLPELRLSRNSTAHSEVSRERNGVVVSERELLAALEQETRE